MGVDEATFYDQSQVAIVPMPPPSICARTWHPAVQEVLPAVRLTLLVGGYAQKWHLGTKAGVTETVRNWRDQAPAVYPLPHPSWRNTAWLRKNPWFEADLLPSLRDRLKEILV